MSLLKSTDTQARHTFLKIFIFVIIKVTVKKCAGRQLILMPPLHFYDICISALLFQLVSQRVSGVGINTKSDCSLAGQGLNPHDPRGTGSVLAVRVFLNLSACMRWFTQWRSVASVDCLDCEQATFTKFSIEACTMLIATSLTVKRTNRRRGACHNSGTYNWSSSAAFQRFIFSSEQQQATSRLLL
jgi:hypothetical protein